MTAEEQIKSEVEKCIAVLKAGGTILYPTDSLWGIGCDATNEEAVKKIYTIKNREESKSLIILIDAAEKLNKYVKDVPAQAWDLVEYAEKPLTIVYPVGLNIARSVINPDRSVAIRVVKNNFCVALIRKFGKPIVSTSANISGENAPLQFSEINEAVLTGVDYVVNLPHEKNKIGKPSTILKIETNGVIKFLRK